MTIKKLMPLFAIAIAVVLAVGISGFKEEPLNPSQNQFFYEYVGPDFSKEQLEDADNYIRSENLCSGSYDVCGVFLATDQGEGNPAAQSELDEEVEDILLSQRDHSAASLNIAMQH